MRATLVVFLSFLASCTSVCASGLTETEAVQRALTQADITASLNARRDIAAGREASAGLWANPEVEYSEESLELPGGPSEERSLWIRQRLDVAGVHGLERDAAAHQRLAEEARTAMAAHEIAAEIRTHFYESLAARAKAALITDWQTRLEELTTAVTNRVAAGDASRYDQLRLERELALLSGEALETQAQAASAHDQLFSLIGGEPIALEGEILPAVTNQINIADVLTAHPLMRAFEAEADSAAIGARAAERERWPKVTLGIGRREFTESNLNADGNMISLGMEIPLFDRGAGKAQTQRHRAHQLRADRARAQARLAADLRSALRTLKAHRQAALSLRSSDEPSSLTAIAESAYTAGEVSVIELLDAHRTELAAQQEFLSRSLAARTAYIELQLLRGELQ